MDISDIINKRHAVKSFKPDRPVPPDTIKQLEKLLRFSPSSVNLQPWHYFIAGSAEGKKRIAESASGLYSYNRPKMLDASCLVVFCSKNTLEDSYLEKLLDREEEEGRFRDIKAREAQKGVKFGFSELHRKEYKDSEEWMIRQVYLSAGFFLLGVSALGLDACPMEGYDSSVLDSALGLREKGYSSRLIIALGYKSSDDFNADLPKSRLSAEDIISRI